MSHNRPEISTGPGHDIIKTLYKIGYTGYRNSEIFDDWISIVEASLAALPAHAAAVQETGRLSEDSPETQKLFERLRKKYPKESFEHFSTAFSHLVLSAEDSFEDHLGSVYMAWGYPNVGQGQFFTPWHVARMMAQIVGQDNEKTLTQRMLDALSKTTQFPTLTEMGFQLTLEFPHTVRFWFENLIEQTASFFEPITICDPCVGSGVMLLSAAATFPRWAIDMGLVQFYGIDIDPTCVQMCKINLMLHGMNSYFVKCANALTEPFVVAMRATSPALNEAYSSAENMTSDEKHELSFAIRNGQYSFFELPVAKEMVEGIV